MSDTTAPGAPPQARPASKASSPRRPSKVVEWWWSILRVFRFDTVKLLWAAMMRFQTHEGFLLAGYIAYATLLAVFPFLIFATTLAAATIGPDQFQALTDLLFDVAPAEVANALQPILEQTFGSERPGLLTFSALAAVWFSSNGVDAFRTAFDRAYAPDRLRNVVVGRLVGVLFVLLGATVSLIIGVAVVAAPVVLHLVEGFTGYAPPWGSGALRYLIAFGCFATYLYLMHWILPSRSPDRIRLWPGIITTIIVWTVAATGFGIYLASYASFSVTYGSLAGVIVTLLFFYLSGAVIIYGAEVNAALARRELEAGSGSEKG